MNVTVLGMYAVNNTQKHFSSSSSALLHLSLMLFASYFVSVTILTSLTWYQSLGLLVSCDPVISLLLISVSGIVIAVFNQSFHNNQAAYHLFDILSN
jgi:hypothetical protein